MKELDFVMREALAHAIYVYLDAVLKRIPVWSGAERATFLQLARQISMDIPIVPTAWGGKLNRIPLGERCGTGRLIVDAASGKYSFEYTNDLHYLTFNESKNANAGGDPNVYSKLKTPGPYNFQVFGEKAFENDAKGTKLPTPWRHVQISMLRVGTKTVF
jgi:hypothetical protein